MLGYFENISYLCREKRREYGEVWEYKEGKVNPSGYIGCAGVQD